MKISIIGCGRVGTTTAYAAMLRGLANEIVLVDVNKDRSKGEELDFIHGTAELSNVSIKSGDYPLIKNSDIVIVTAGIPRKPGETRLDLAAKNVNVIKTITQEVIKYSPDSILLMVSNPVDIMTHIASREYGNNAGRVFGLGNVLDQLRFRSMVGKAINVHPTKINALIVGEHGDSMVILDELVTVNGLPLSSYGNLSKDRMDSLIHDTKYGGAKLITLKGGTYYAVGIAICQVIEAIKNDTREILPLCFPQQWEGEEVTFSSPAIIGKQGILGTVELDIGEGKRKMLNNSITIIKEMIADLDIK